MVQARLSGFVQQWDVTQSPATKLSGGYVKCEASTWAAAKAGTGTVTMSNNSISSGTQESGGTYDIYRAVFIYEIPSNLSRLDQDPQIKFYPYTIANNPTVIASSLSDAISGESSFSTDNFTAAQWFSNIQTSTSALYSGADTTIVEDEYNTLDLSANDGLAKYHILNRRYFSIALIDYQYDYLDSAPASAASNMMGIKMATEAEPAFLVLRKPWFIDDRGNEFPIAEDFTIRAFEVGVNQIGRSVPQLPFSTAIKGPISLRNKNVPYKVTT